MRFWVLWISFVIMASPAYTAEKMPVITVSGPTLIAFFAPVTQEEVEKSGDTSEVLNDFQWHLREVKQKLQKAGISVHEIYVRKFAVVTDNKRKVFKPGKIDVGYYFVKPGKVPKVEYGVMSNVDIVDASGVYFGLKQLRRTQ
ncbi:hypothetical protein KP004_14315 [Geomonas oryzisoli]|uniref:Uncharacterized protein n=1 Tax=Geomonas oryzisoli TaxID=2847992 RepID=A0ABX8J217_9BACT|nr:hypothetical protein [Geomonas oryzisoli]QWV92374.1 hypothetical protein KP004_14315 [Geomonas oryzisoli]